MSVLFTLFVAATFAASTFQEFDFTSTNIGATKYLIYFPDGYKNTTQYKIIYGFHGMGADHTIFKNYQAEFDKAIADKKVSPFILAAPRANTSFYIDTAAGFKFETYFYKEFIPYIEKTYKVNNATKQRMVLGTSMGGFGAGYYSLVHKDMFGATAMLSPSLLPEAMMNTMNCSNATGNQQLMMFCGTFGNATYYKAHNYAAIVKSKPAGTFTVPTYICVSKNDSQVYNPLKVVKPLMTEYKIPHEWEEDEKGEHSPTYWKTKMPKALEFIQKYWTEADKVNPNKPNSTNTTNNTNGIYGPNGRKNVISSILMVLSVCILFLL